MEESELKEEEIILKTPTKEAEVNEGILLTEVTMQDKEEKEILKSISEKLDMILATQNINV